MGLRLVQTAHAVHHRDVELHTCSKAHRMSSSGPFAARSATNSQRAECPKIRDAPDGSGRRKRCPRAIRVRKTAVDSLAVKLFALMVVGGMVTFSTCQVDGR